MSLKATFAPHRPSPRCGSKKYGGKTVSISFYTIAVLAASPMLAIQSSLAAGGGYRLTSPERRRARQPSIMRDPAD
jgi:hypothetical protein